MPARERAEPCATNGLPAGPRRTSIFFFRVRIRVSRRRGRLRYPTPGVWRCTRGSASPTRATVIRHQKLALRKAHARLSVPNKPEPPRRASPAATGLQGFSQGKPCRYGGCEACDLLMRGQASSAGPPVAAGLALRKCNPVAAGLALRGVLVYSEPIGEREPFAGQALPLRGCKDFRRASPAATMGGCREGAIDCRTSTIARAAGTS